MPSNTYPDHTQTGQVLDQNHGIEHIREGSKNAYYPWFRNAEHKAIYYLANENLPWTRVRKTTFGEAYNFLAFQRGLAKGDDGEYPRLPGLPYPIVQGMELEEDYYEK